jgi:hypothetical protein
MKSKGAAERRRGCEGELRMGLFADVYMLQWFGGWACE